MALYFQPIGSNPGVNDHLPGKCLTSAPPVPLLQLSLKSGKLIIIMIIVSDDNLVWFT